MLLTYIDIYAKIISFFNNQKSGNQFEGSIVKISKKEVFTVLPIEYDGALEAGQDPANGDDRNVE